MFIFERFIRSKHFLTNGIFTILFYIVLSVFQNEPTLLDCKNFKAISSHFYDMKIEPK